jgi:hypothetical protein
VATYTHRVQVFGMPWQGRRRFSIAHPSIPSRWGGRSFGCPMTYSHSRREGARGWAIQFRPSLCSSTDILYAMGIYAAVRRVDPAARGRVEGQEPDEKHKARRGG